MAYVNLTSNNNNKLDELIVIVVNKDYSYLSASMGSSIAARRAGQIPKIRPTDALKRKAIKMEEIET